MDSTKTTEYFEQEENNPIENPKKFELFLDKDLFAVTISHNKKSISFHATKINKTEDIFYESNYKFNELIKLDKSFRIYDTANEIYEAIIKFFNQKKVFIKEIGRNEINLEIKITSITGEDVDIIIGLTKKETNKDFVINQLFKKINLIKKNNQNLKNKISIIENELNEIKNWKNQKEKEIENLKELNKNKIILKDIDSKIFKNAEEIEFIEKRLKKDNEYLKDRKLELKLLYRATRDGGNASDFHQKCDYIKGTLTLLKTTKGFRFGGFTNESWDGDKGYKKDKSAFCFSLDFKKIYNVKTDKAIYAYSSCSASFGYNMFYIQNCCFKNSVKTDDGLNINYDNQKIKSEISGGEEEVQVVEVEVFQVLFD